MEELNINIHVSGIDYTYLWFNPNKKARYGLALTYWYTNIEDLLFFVKYVNNWVGRELIDVSICSYAKLNDSQKQILIDNGVNYIVDCLQDKGHQDGTTAHCNGAIYPLITNKNIKTVLHTDADVILLNASYFFYFSNLVLDLDKVILTSQASYGYDTENIKITNRSYLGSESDTMKQFGSMFVLNCTESLNYFPFKLNGHFEFDRYTQFVECGYTLEDAIILKRIVNGEDNTNSIDLLNGMNFHLGLSHSTNLNNFAKDNILKLNQYDRV